MRKKRAIKIIKWTFSILFSIVVLFTASLYIFKDQIIEVVLNEVNGKLKRPIETKEVDLTFWSSFPYLEIDMKEVYIQSALEKSQHNDTLLFTNHLYLKFSPFDLIDGNYEVKSIHISPGKANLHVNHRGEANYDILKPSDDRDDDFLLKLNAISFEHFDLNYQNDLTDEHIETALETVNFRGNFSDREFNLSTKGDINLKKLRNGEVTLLTNKNIQYEVKLNVNNENEAITLDPSLIRVENLPFQVSAKLDRDSLNFKVESQQILLTDMIHEFLSDREREVKKMQGEGTINFVLSGNGGTKKGDKTNIKCNFGIQNGRLVEPYKKTVLSGISLDGFYSNIGERGDELLAIREFQCTSASGPFSGDLKITRFNNPKIEGKAKGKIDLGVVYAIFQPKGIEVMDGLLDVNCAFDLQNEAERDEMKISSLQAGVSLKNGILKLNGEKNTFKKIHAGIYLNGDKLRFQNTQFTYGSSDIELTGEVINVVDYLSGKQQLKPSLNLYCNNLNIDEYLSSAEDTDPNVHLLPEDISGTISLNSQKVIYQNHTFGQLSAMLRIDNKQLSINQFHAQNAEAIWRGKIDIHEKTPSQLQLTGSIATTQVDLKNLFGEWNNLYQDNLTTEHIVQGKAAIFADFDIPYDALKEEVDFDKLKAKLHLSLTNNRFRNIPLFKEMTNSMKNNASKLLLGKRNIDYLDSKLADFTIPKLENTISISNGNIIIPKMTITTSAMEVELAGVHGFNDIVDYRIALNARDLRDIEYKSEFGEIEYDETGARLFVHISGHLDNLNFSWDKGAHKEQLKEKFKEEKEEIKAMLKSEFGLFKKDSTVKKYEPTQPEKEQIRINFNQKSQTEVPKRENKQQKEKKEGILKKTLKNWKEQEEEEQESPTFKIGG